MVSGAGEGNRTLLPSVSFRLDACRYAVSGLNHLLVSAQYVTVFSTLYRQWLCLIAGTGLLAFRLGGRFF